MPDFLAEMAGRSRERAASARKKVSESALLARVGRCDPPPALRLDPGGFDVVAEIKRRSPTAGILQNRGGEATLTAKLRARAYAKGGAAALSVLTEPTAFGGCLRDLRVVARSVDLPVLRKDFLVEPYQLVEARAAGAAGALLIVRLLQDTLLAEMLQTAAALGLFVLLEAFDRLDLDRLAGTLPLARRLGVRTVAGVNARDLITLRTDADRMIELARHLPTGIPRVAESGLSDEGDIRRAARAGYNVALIGSALMRSRRPAELLADLVRAGREQTRMARCTSA